MSTIANLVLSAGSNRTDQEMYRRNAVAAALEVIAANVQGAGTHGLLEEEMKKLSTYADQIQEALKIK